MAQEAVIFTENKMLIIVGGAFITAIVGAIFSTLGWSIRKNVSLIEDNFRGKMKKLVDEVHATCDNNVSTLITTEAAVREVDKDLKELNKRFGEHVIQDQAAFESIKVELERNKEDLEQIKDWCKSLSESSEHTSRSLAVLVERVGGIRNGSEDKL